MRTSGASTSLRAPARTFPVADDAIIGREKELRQLAEVLERNRPQLVLIHGAAGIGKSRLLREVRSRAELSGWQPLPEDELAIAVTPEDSEESLIRRLRASLRVGGDQFAAPASGEVVEPPPVKPRDDRPMGWKGLLRPILNAADDVQSRLGRRRSAADIADELARRSPLLVTLEMYGPDASVGRWLHDALLPALVAEEAPVVLIATTSRHSDVEQFAAAASAVVELGPLDIEAVRQRIEESAVELDEKELAFYTDVASRDPHLLGSLARVLALTAPRAAR